MTAQVDALKDELVDADIAEADAWAEVAKAGIVDSTVTELGKAATNELLTRQAAAREQSIAAMRTRAGALVAYRKATGR